MTLPALLLLCLSAIVLMLAFVRGPMVALPLLALLAGAYISGLLEYPQPAPLAGAVGVGLLLARGLAPGLATLVLFLYCITHRVAAGLLGNAAALDVAGLVVHTNAIVASGLLAAIAAAAFDKRPRLNWFHVTYAPLVASAALPSAILLAGPELVSPTKTWLAAALVALVACGSHALASYLRSEPLAANLPTVGGRRLRFPYPVELRRQLARFRRAVRDGESISTLPGAPKPGDARPVEIEPGPADSSKAAGTSSPHVKRMRAALTECHVRFSTLFENAPHAVLFTDLHGKIISANRATKKVLGFASSSLLGTDIKRLIPPGSDKTSHPLDLDVLIKAPGETISIHSDADVLRQDGSTIRTAILVNEVAGSRKCKYAIQILLTDEVERAEKLLRKVRATARASSEARIETLAAMSHELRTPLHGLIATLDMLRDEPLTKEGSRQLAVAKTSANSLLNLVNDVLDIARMKGSKFPLKAEPFSITDVLLETINEFRARALAKGLDLTYEITAHDLPKSHIGDRQRVKQVLANLLSNAINFTSYGGVSVRLGREAGTIILDVSDTGPGVPAAYVNSIFEPFIRAKTDGASGTGLGLSISRQLCRAMGGDLVLLSTGSSGSTFRVTLKLEESDEQAPEEHSGRLYMNPAGKILVVEDHQINQYVVKAMLDSLGCTTTMVSSGSDALEVLKREQFDLVLMDCRMPGLDGYETTRRARRALQVRTPIVAMTANASEEERQACLDAGMDDFLPKPFKRSQLSSVLCKWLDSRVQKGVLGTAADATIDKDMFDELWESLGWQESSMRTICESFLETIDACTRSISEGETDDISRHLHTLRGTSAMIGAREVNRIASEIQSYVKAGRSEGLKELAAELRTAGTTFRNAFYDRLNDKLGYARPSGSRDRPSR